MATAKPKSTRLDRTIAMKDGKLRLVAIADTHSAPHERSVGLIEELHPDAILHAGDIGDLAVLHAFAQVAPVHAVRGNIDEHELPDELVLAIHNERGDTVLTLLLFHIAVYGAKLRADAFKKAKAAGAALVVCGHSHVPFIGRDKGLGIFNPGSIGPRRFQLPIVFGVMDLTRDERGLGLSMRHISCETGAVWTPS